MVKIPKIGKSKYKSNLASRKLFLSIIIGVVSVAVAGVSLFFLLPRKNNLSISGSISIAVEDNSLVNINTRVFGYKDVLTQQQGEKLANDMSISTLNQISTMDTLSLIKDYNKSVSTNNNGQFKNINANTSDISLKYSDAYTYFVVINIENLGQTEAVELNLLNTSKVEITNSWEYCSSNSVKIAAGDSKNLVCAFGSNNDNVNNNGTFDYDLKIKHINPAVVDIVSDNDHNQAIQSFVYNDGKFTTTYQSPVDEQTGIDCAHLINISLKNIAVAEEVKISVECSVFSVTFLANRHINNLEQGDMFTLASTIVRSGSVDDSEDFCAQMTVNDTNEYICLYLLSNEEMQEVTITIEFVESSANKISFNDIKAAGDEGFTALCDVRADVLYGEGYGGPAGFMPIEFVDVDEDAVVEVSVAVDPDDMPENMVIVDGLYAGAPEAEALIVKNYGAYPLAEAEMQKYLCTGYTTCALVKGQRSGFAVGVMGLASAIQVPLNFKIVHDVPIISLQDDVMNSDNYSVSLDTIVVTDSGGNIYHMANLVVKDVCDDVSIYLDWSMSLVDYTDLMGVVTNKNFFDYNNFELYLNTTMSYLKMFDSSMCNLSVLGKKGQTLQLCWIFTATNIGDQSIKIPVGIATTITKSVISYNDFKGVHNGVSFGVPTSSALFNESIMVNVANITITDISKIDDIYIHFGNVEFMFLLDEHCTAAQLVEKMSSDLGYLLNIISDQCTDIIMQSAGSELKLSVAYVQLSGGILPIANVTLSQWDCVDKEKFSENLKYTLNNDGTGYEVESSLQGKDRSEQGIVIVPETYKGMPVTKIANYGFKECSTSVIFLPSTITEIGRSAFENVPITRIDGGENVRVIHNKAFYYAHIYEINFPKLVSIGSSAFAYCDNLQSLSLPEGLTTIESQAFSYCKKLKEIILPNSLKELGDNFSGCSELITVSFPDDLTEINLSFYYSPNVANVYFGNNVTSFEGIFTDTAWYNALPTDAMGNKFAYARDGVTKYVFGPNTSAESLDLTNVMWIEDTYLYSTHFSHINLGSTITVLPEYLGYNTTMTEVVIPNQVTDINRNVFSNSNTLASVTIGANVKYISSYAFINCPNLTTIVVDDSNPYYTSRDSEGNQINAIINRQTGELVVKGVIQEVPTLDYIKGVGENMYAYSSITEITLPSNITYIGDKAFYNCSELTSITIEGNITHIGNDAFFGCKSLTTINLPASVTYIGDYAFYECENLVSVNIGPNVKYIGSNAFVRTKITEINLPEGLTYVGGSAFSSTNLQSVVIPSTLTELNGYLFNACYALTSVQLPSTLTYIGNSVFGSCKFTSINLPSSLTYIGNSAFAGVPLTTVNIPSSVKYIGEGAFADIAELTSVTLNEGLLYIDNRAFASSAFNSIIIPSTVRYIGANAFGKSSSDEFPHTLLGDTICHSEAFYMMW